jgi:hypothetical protein
MARKFGTALLTYSMGLRHEIRFKSYDRLYPSAELQHPTLFGPLHKSRHIDAKPIIESKNA